MQHITTRLAGPLVWKQRSVFKSEYELRAGDGLVAEILFRGTLKTVSTARSEDGCWTLREAGILHSRTLIRPCDSEDVVATFYPKTWSSRGMLELKNGARYFIKARPFRSRTEVKSSEDAPPVLTFKTEGFWRTQTHVEFHASASSVSDLPLLVLFGFYYIVCQQRAGAIAAAA
jgi:hypothetical protein